LSALEGVTTQNLLPLIKEEKIASDIMVTVRYEDLNQRAYEHQWEVSARLYEGVRMVDYQGMTNLVDVVEQLRDEGLGNTKG
jgi:hypothetical protein